MALIRDRLIPATVIVAHRWISKGQLRMEGVWAVPEFSTPAEWWQPGLDANEGVTRLFERHGMAFPRRRPAPSDMVAKAVAGLAKARTQRCRPTERQRHLAVAVSSPRPKCVARAQVLDVNRDLARRAFPFKEMTNPDGTWNGLDGARPFWDDRVVMEARPRSPHRFHTSP